MPVKIPTNVNTKCKVRHFLQIDRYGQVSKEIPPTPVFNTLYTATIKQLQSYKFKTNNLSISTNVVHHANFSKLFSPSSYVFDLVNTSQVVAIVQSKFKAQRITSYDA